MALTFPPARQPHEDDLAERLLRRFLAWCDDPRNQRRSLGLVMSALRQRRGARLTFQVLNKLILGPVLKASGSAPSAARMELVGAQLFAIAMVRYRVKVEPIASMEIDELVALYAPAIRATLNAEQGQPLETVRRTGPRPRPRGVPDWADLDPVRLYKANGRFSR